MKVWILLLMLYRGGVAQVEMGSKESCVAALKPYDDYVSIHPSCLNRQTGEVIKP